MRFKTTLICSWGKKTRSDHRKNRVAQQHERCIHRPCHTSTPSHHADAIAHTMVRKANAIHAVLGKVHSRGVQEDLLCGCTQTIASSSSLPSAFSAAWHTANSHIYANTKVCIKRRTLNSHPHMHLSRVHEPPRTTFGQSVAPSKSHMLSPYTITEP